MLSLKTRTDILSAWTQGIPPSVVATKLRLALATVIKEYVHFDNIYGDQP